MSDLASPTRRGPFVQAWSNDSSRAGIGLQRTVSESISQELEFDPGTSGALGQLARLSFPIGIGPQGVLLDEGYDTVRISGSGELPPEGNGPIESIDEDTIGAAWPRHAAHVHGARHGPAAGPRSRELRDGGEPGDAGLGAVAARRHAAPAGARRRRRRVRSGAAAADRRAAVAALAGGLDRALPGRLRGGRAARAGGGHALAAARAGATGRAAGGRRGGRRARRRGRGDGARPGAGALARRAARPASSPRPRVRARPWRWRSCSV